MAHIQKRQWESGVTTYVVRWRMPDGTEQAKGGFTTRRAAKAYAAKVETRGNAFDPRAGAIVFRAAAADWLASRTDLKPSTLDGYRYALAPASQRRGDGKTLGIDAVFGGYPLNAITRDDIQAWVKRLIEAGKKPSTVRHAYFTVRMVMAQALADNRIAANPADYVKLPGEHSATGGIPGVVDDPAQFLTPQQVSALVAATAWPYAALVHVAAWAGLRAGELAGLQVGDVELPAVRPGSLRVDRTVRVIGGTLEYLTPKTKGSRRRVPLTAGTTAMLRRHLALHPRADDPTAPLFPAMRLVAARPTSKAAPKPAHGGKQTAAQRQAHALAMLTVQEAGERLVLDWAQPLRHQNWYKAVYRPAVLRAMRQNPRAGLSEALKFHSLRHTYASLCVAAGIPPLEISRFMGHAKVTTTLGIYTHLFNTDDHAGAMSALDALVMPVPAAPAVGGNVVPLRR